MRRAVSSIPIGWRGCFASPAQRQRRCRRSTPSMSISATATAFGANARRPAATVLSAKWRSTRRRCRSSTRCSRPRPMRSRARVDRRGIRRQPGRRRRRHRRRHVRPAASRARATLAGSSDRASSPLTRELAGADDLRSKWRGVLIPCRFDGSGGNRGHLAIREAGKPVVRPAPTARLNPLRRREPADERGTRDCERCGKPIPARRLEVLPYTRLCIECSESDRRRLQDLHYSRTYGKARQHEEELRKLEGRKENCATSRRSTRNSVEHRTRAVGLV